MRFTAVMIVSVLALGAITIVATGTLNPAPIPDPVAVP